MTGWIAEAVGSGGKVIELGAMRGLDFDLGGRLIVLMKDAGYSELNACFVQPVLSMKRASEFVRMGATEIEPFAVQCGLISKTEGERALQELTNSEFGDNCYYTFPRQAQVFGRK